MQAPCSCQMEHHVKKSLVYLLPAAADNELNIWATRGVKSRPPPPLLCSLPSLTARQDEASEWNVKHCVMAAKTYVCASDHVMWASPACDDLLYRWRGSFTGSHEQRGSQAEQAALLNPSGVGGGVQGAEPKFISTSFRCSKLSLVHFCCVIVCFIKNMLFSHA